MRRKLILGLAVLFVGILVAVYAVPVAVQDLPSKSKGQYATNLGTTTVTFTPDTGYLFSRLVIMNDDATNNLFIAVGATTIAGTGGSTADFFLKPGESITLDVVTVSVALEASGSNTDYRIFGLEVRK